MSVFIVSPEHIHVLLDAALRYTDEIGMTVCTNGGQALTIDRPNRDAVGQMLLDTNAACAAPSSPPCPDTPTHPGKSPPPQPPHTPPTDIRRPRDPTHEERRVPGERLTSKQRRCDIQVPPRSHAGNLQPGIFLP